MSLSEILGILSVCLLIILVYLQISGSRKNKIEVIENLLKKNADEQRESVQKQIASGATEQFERFGVIQKSVQDTLSSNSEQVNRKLSQFQQLMQNQLTDIQKASAENNNQIGKTVNDSLQKSREEQNKQLHTFGEQVENRLTSVQRANTENLEKVNSTIENKMKELQESNEKRLEQMQGIVDEKLQKTLETRLSQSFELVSKQLENVGQGLGEMKALAADTKSLKNALTNVKERGTYGEVRLEKLLSDILAPNQYEMNVEIENGKRVEFAIKLPGRNDVPLLLPIDSKFPIEDYNRLLDAEDKQMIDEARKSLAAKIRTFAKDIHDKYIVVPKTTDFALMFLPTEGLYAEVVQNAALFEELRDKYKVTAVGATTLSAYLASLQLGFKTLAIEQRSQEVWETLSKVKSEFNKFEGLLNKARDHIHKADDTLNELSGKRTRAINRSLRNVETLPDQPETPLISSEESEDD